MNITDTIKDFWLFDDHLKAITGPLLVAAALWLARLIKRLCFPFFFIFKINLSSGFISLPVEDKVSALQIISEFNDADGKYNILMKELKLKQYGLFYPLPILRVVFDYIYDNNVRMNSTGFLSFLDCNQIFNYNREEMPVCSLKKLTVHIVSYTLFLAFLAWYSVGVFNSIVTLYHSTVNFINISTIILMFIIIIMILWFSYIFIESFVSLFWAVSFSKKLRRYAVLREQVKLIKKYEQ
ncbi:MAG: hypothetical protein E6Z83_13565 [Pantoea sp.]|uniref:Uncharacterized protein n=1 Tax=Pantoea septica TaxID=472695 RepID=A0ABX3UX60_9GAMM|nr:MULTISPECIES: hypothetical protein [Pantoea]MDU5781818.1 hypothetical protein [Pantoea sp.]ORN03673.1 hypothetical protein HA46_00275 [Pantoea septica]